ncbi:ROK family transcriptional regulator [Virgibacillus soli]|uniref:ROK family transcriptional regulator n=1 Tax=Paracerasibacillus soli TaxID=480284 RepID=A0ABU5CMU2_9BACI|nr:ROK family transcriptional regulator [Virgibacillus soli]MDY0407683.1 ROK family transcriptional regulator [Virgibacillus soli]
MQRGTFQLMKSVNKSLVLNKIRTNEPISRAEIAKQTKLTPPTVSSIVKELLEQEIIMESNLGESKGGRKPTMLHINDEAFLIIGADVGPADVDCVLTNLSGKVLFQTSKKLSSQLTNDQFLAILKNCIQSVVDFVDNQEKIVGIGVAMHGVVDVETGTSLFAPNLHLTNVPIKDELEKEFGFDVKVENDARAMALGESWFGKHGKINSMVAINLGSGVGAGAVVDGKLYHGAQDLAGEIGHMTIDLNGTICECGNRGCLQTFASGPAIVKRANEKLKQENDDEISPTVNLTGEKIYRMAVNGNQNMVQVLKETGTYLGIGLTNLIHIMNPEVIVIGGGVSKAQQFLLPAVQETIEKWALTSEAKQTKVVVSRLGDHATLLGAVSLLLVELFSIQ